MQMIWTIWKKSEGAFSSEKLICNEFLMIYFISVIVHNYIYIQF